MSRSEAARQEALARDGFRCQVCGKDGRDITERGSLHVHHVESLGMGGSTERDTADNMITLCVDCHKKVHDYALSIVRWGEGEFEVTDREGRKIDHRRLWFHRRARAEQLQPIEATIQGMYRVDGSVAEALHTLWKDDAWQYLDPEAKSYRDFAASRGWDVRRAVELAKLYDKGLGRGLEWPPGTTASEYRRTLKNLGAIKKREWWWVTFSSKEKLIELVNRGDIVVERATDDAYFDEGKIGIRVGKCSRLKTGKGTFATLDGVNLYTGGE